MALRAVEGARTSSSDVPIVSTSPPTKRRPTWVIAGCAMVLLAALLGAYVFQAVTDEMSVVVAADDLLPGEPIDAADLRVVQMGQAGSLRAIQSDQQDLIIGQAPRAPIPAGTVLNTSLFVAEADALPAGQVVVGATFQPGEVPIASLRPGDVVALIVVAPSGPGGAASTEGSPEPSVVGEATVWAVSGADAVADAAGGGVSTSVFVSLLVDEPLQTVVAQAASADLLRLSLVGP